MSDSMKQTAIWWIRRDLRLRDNQALNTAIQSAEVVIPVFILDPILWNLSKTGSKRLAFLADGLRRLDENLHVAGSRLIIRRGHPIKVLKKLIDEVDATKIFAEEDYSPYARQRDTEVASQLPLALIPGLTIHHPSDVLKKDNTPYTIFTPFSKAWKLLPAPPATIPMPERIHTPSGLASEKLQDFALEPLKMYPAGELEALKRLGAFTSGSHPPIYDYHIHRDRPDLNGTSALSPYFRFGMISARQAVRASLKVMQRVPSKDARKGAETWLNELIWREFFLAILYHFPQVYEGSFREDLQNIRWANDPGDFEAWCTGRTGYPIVDAGMRQLFETGWMHNRIRMIVASFLTKDLLIDWQWGEKWFMQNLIDGDPAANNGGWQWAAGTGTDAAPYFRVFNPVLQGKKSDPDGLYVRRWIPELKNVPMKYIHSPWDMPAAEQERAGCVIGVDYPPPIVDHSWARERTLDAYGLAKE